MRYEPLLAALIGLAGCTSPRAEQPPLQTVQPPVGVTHRAFRMGFTSWPYAASIAAVQGTYVFIGANGDLLTEHLEEGVPWAEMLRDEPLPQWFLTKMEDRKRNRPPGVKLLLSLTPLNMGRNALAECAGEGQRPPLPAELQGKPWNDPNLVRGYTNYCLRMIELFRPDYALTGIEANELLNNKPAEWDAYVALSRQVQREVRRRFPGLPLSESITLHKLLDRANSSLPEYRAKIKALVAGHDFFAVSFYPLMLGLHKPQEFAAALDFLPTFTTKLIAFSETGHPAEPINIAAYKFQFPASPAEQAAYLRVLLSQAEAHRYLFVSYFTHRDFDALWQTFPDAVKDLGAIWRDTGLLTDSGTPRPACRLWQRWFAAPLAPGR
jgi:hypothetical protein